MSDEFTPNNSSDMGEANDAVRFRNNLFASLSLPKTRVSFPLRASRPDGTAASAKPKEWWNANGQFHRDDGPARTWADGSQEWYRDGSRQPDPPPPPSDKDLPPTSVRPDGTKEWRNAKGQFHRDDGPAITWANGTQAWYRDGKCHRDVGPAFTWSDDSQEWYRDGKRHRDDGPAVTWSNGRQFWYRDGKRQPDPPPPPDKDLPPTRVRPDGSKEWRNAKDQLHRDDGPARTFADGSQYWFRDGKCHRDDGPAITWADGSQFWYRDGERHRDDGPALIAADGYQEWFRDGKCHRDDGPAVTRADSSQEWFRDGERQCPVITKVVHE